MLTTKLQSKHSQLWVIASGLWLAQFTTGCTTMDALEDTLDVAEIATTSDSISPSANFSGDLAVDDLADNLDDQSQEQTGADTEHPTDAKSTEEATTSTKQNTATPKHDLTTVKPPAQR